MEIELWKDIIGYENIYQISSFGRVKSLKRPWVKETHIMSMSTGTDGYLAVHLRKNNERKRFRIHQLVALHFLEKKKNNSEVCHGTEGKTNNSVSNLSWGTPKENSLDKKRDGSVYQLNKNVCNNGHLFLGKNLKMEGNKRRCVSCRSVKLLRSDPLFLEKANAKYKEIMQ